MFNRDEQVAIRTKLFSPGCSRPCCHHLLLVRILQGLAESHFFVIKRIKAGVRFGLVSEFYLVYVCVD